MTNTNLYNHIHQGLQMELLQQQIQIQLTKTQLLEVIQEALTTDASAAIKRAIAPVLAEAFPQFPEFTQVVINGTDESGATTITLRQPRQAAAKASPIKSMEPLEVEVEPEDDEPTDNYL